MAATYMGHKPAWRGGWGTGYTPPATVRPPSIPEARSGGGNPNPYNQRGGVLPGPGPSAGGRYRWYGPQPAPGMPTPMGTPSTYPDNDFSKNMRRLRLLRQIGRMSPVGRAMNLGFTLLGEWSQTKPKQEDKTKVAPVPPGWFIDCFDPVGEWDIGWGTGIGYIQSCPGGSCIPNFYVHTWSQAVDYWNLGLTNINGVPFSFGTGPQNGPNTTLRRAAMKLKVCTHGGFTGPPGLRYDPRVYIPAKVAPQPGTVVPPRSWPDPYPMPALRDRPSARARRGPRPGPRTKPSPYWSGPPQHPVPVKTLPRPGERKQKVEYPWFADEIYGPLTELGDGLKCFEKNAKGLKSQGKGLHNRLAAASLHAWYRPNDVDWQGFFKCLVLNHFEDKIIGKANKLANNVTKSPYWVRPVGIGAGSWSRRMS